MVERRILDDPLDAVVQLELKGVTFEVKGGRLSFANLPADPATNEFLRTRLDMIRENKSQVIAWLSSRTDSDLLSQLDKTQLYLADQVHFCEVWQEKYRRNEEAWRNVLVLALEKIDELETKGDSGELSDAEEKRNANGKRK